MAEPLGKPLTFSVGTCRALQSKYRLARLVDCVVQPELKFEELYILCYRNVSY